MLPTQPASAPAWHLASSCTLTLPSFLAKCFLLAESPPLA